MTFVLSFAKTFILKFFTTKAIEKMVIITLKELVKRTESKVDDALFEAVFGKMEAIEE
jgi:hypothetical protein